MKILKKSDATEVLAHFSAALVAQKLQEIEWRENDWLFSFIGGVELRVACPWRIVSEGRLVFAEADNGQRFGLPAPIDGPRKSRELLLGRAVERMAIREDTADLTIVFRTDVLLEIWSNSSGYEPWELMDRSGAQVVAMGGGELSIRRTEFGT